MCIRDSLLFGERREGTAPLRRIDQASVSQRCQGIAIATSPGEWALEPPA